MKCEIQWWPFTLPTNQANLAQPICGGPNQLCFLVGDSNDYHFLLYLSSLQLLHIRVGTRLETFQFMMPGNTAQIWCIEAEGTLGSLKNPKEPILLIIDLDVSRRRSGIAASRNAPDYWWQLKIFKRLKASSSRNI